MRSDRGIFMNTLKLSGKTLCSLIAVVLFVVSMAGIVSAATDGTTAGATACYGYTTLKPNQQQVYKLLHTAVQSDTPDTSVDISKWNISKDELKSIVSIYVSDHPEAFWFQGLFLWGYGADPNVPISVIPIFELDGKLFTNKYYKATEDTSDDNTPLYDISELTKAKTEFQSAADAVIAEMNAANLRTDAEKALWLHDKVAALVSYVSTNNDQTAYGALVEKQAVCAGYTRLYQYLLQRVVIRSWAVTGVSVKPNSSESVPHAWNLVWLGDACVYTDVTWNDQDTKLYHLYYARNYDAFSGAGADHALDTLFNGRLPECTAACAHQYLYNNPDVLLGDITAQDIAARMVLGDDNKTFTAKFLDPSGKLTEWLNTPENMRAVGSMLGCNGYSGSKSSMSGRVGVEIHLTLISLTEVSAQKVVKGSVQCSTASPADLLTIEFIPENASEVKFSIRIAGCSTEYALRNISSGTYTMRVTAPKHVPREYTVTIP